MRKTRRFLSMLAAFCLILTASVPALAAEDDYTYTVRIYSGKQGSIEGSDVKEYTGLHYGDRVSFYPQSQVSLNDDSKYYVRGLRESGKDNSESVAAASFTVTGDADYVVAYGLLGSAVQYTVRYVDANGAEILPSETFYGNVGDSPVIAYRFVEGYQPQAYNLTGVLYADASQNVYTFTYRQVTTPTTAPTTAATTPTTTAANTPTTTAADNANTPSETPVENPAGNPTDNSAENPAEDPSESAAEGNESDANTPEKTDPQEIVDIRESEAPLANQQLPSGDVSSDGTAFPTAAKIGIAGLGAVAAIGVVYLVIRMKKKSK